MKKRMIITIVFCACLMFFTSSCGVYQLNQRKNPDKLIMNQNTTLNSYELELANKYQKEIYDLFLRLKEKTEMDRGLVLNEGRYSVGFFTPAHSISRVPLVVDDPLYFGSIVLTGAIYNRNRTSFTERASTVFVNYVKVYLSYAFLSSSIPMQKDERIKGVCVYLIWGLNDRINEFSSITADYTESLKVYASWEIIKAFLNNEISVQEFADKIDIIGIYNGNEMGKIKIDTQKLL